MIKVPNPLLYLHLDPFHPQIERWETFNVSHLPMRRKSYQEPTWVSSRIYHGHDLQKISDNSCSNSAIYIYFSPLNYHNPTVYNVEPSSGLYLRQLNMEEV
jgi:hypothetical protein